MKEFNMSPEELLAKRQAALAERPQIEAGLKKAALAAKEAGFSGWLRRQIHATPQVSLKKIWQAAGITHNQLNDFLEGSGELTTGQVDAICATLGIVPAGVEKVA